MRYRPNISFVIILIIILSSCSLPRVVDSSEKHRPEWVYGITKSHITVEGVGIDWETAQNDALKKLKERIVNSISVNVSSETNVEINETVINNISTYHENTNKKTNVSSDFFNTLKGINLNKAKSFYWEKQKHKDRSYKIHYHIMYPFSETELNKLIQDWEKIDQDFTDELNSLEKQVDNCDLVPELIILHEKTKALENIFTRQRKTKTLIMQSEINQLLNDLKFEVETHQRGKVVLKLHSVDRYFKMSKYIDFESSCATYKDVNLIDDNKALEIIYDADYCYQTMEPTFTVSQNYGEKTITANETIPEGEKNIHFFINTPIRLKKSPVKYGHFKCFVPIRIYTDIPFEVTKIELLVSKERAIDIGNSTGNKKEFFYTEVGQTFEYKGDYSIQFDISATANSQLETNGILSGLLNALLSANNSYYAGGKIYAKIKGEEKEFVYPFYHKKIEINK